MNARQSRERIAADHPLLEGLNEEDLQIAHDYHDAETHVRQFITAFLTGEESHRVVALVRRLHQLPTLWLPIFEDLLAAADRAEAPRDAPPAARPPEDSRG